MENPLAGRDLQLSLGGQTTPVPEATHVSRSAVRWSVASIAVGLAVALAVLAGRGAPAALNYLTAYSLEQALSIDNLFVFVVVFETLRIPAEYQRRVLYWGVLGALLARCTMIAAGVHLFARFHWITYPFGVLILLSAARLVWAQKREIEIVEKSCGVCSSWVARIIPVTPVLHGGRFWIRSSGRLVATPLLIALFVIETTDVVFALDSVPAVLSITRDPLVVYSSNAFALLGMRSLYFAIASAAARFDRLRFGLAAILAFTGAKMLLGDVVEVPTPVSLAVIAMAILIAVAVSHGYRQAETYARRPDVVGCEPAPYAQYPSTSTIASAKARGASCGRL